MLTRLLKALGLLFILLCLTAAASAEVQRHPLLDSAFKLLEKDNIFQRRYNELTGAQVTSRLRKVWETVPLETSG